MQMLPSGLPELVEGEEDLARFLTSSSHFNSVGVKPSAFLPNPANRETSIFRHGAHPDESLWRIAQEHVTTSRTLHGVAVFKAKHVRDAGLDVTAAEPPPRHANIVRWPWPDGDPEMGKAERRERAILIAQYAELVRR